jgi:hypothetical protein
MKITQPKVLTPRTDAEYIGYQRKPSFLRFEYMTDLAKQLEQELSESNANLDKFGNHLVMCRSHAQVGNPSNCTCGWTEARKKLKN